MTATVDYKTRLVSELIHSCYKAQEGYQSAAKAVEDATLKRLFEIYAQQRTRFAQELREHLPIDEFEFGSGLTADLLAEDRNVSKQESIRKCLEMDARNLALYKEALARRTLPTRAHFLISSQLALMERVHDRMNLMLNERPPAQARPGLQPQRVSA